MTVLPELVPAPPLPVVSAGLQPALASANAHSGKSHPAPGIFEYTEGFVFIAGALCGERRGVVKDGFSLKFALVRQSNAFQVRRISGTL